LTFFDIITQRQTDVEIVGDFIVNRSKGGIDIGVEIIGK